MKLNFLIFAMLLAAMSPSREPPPPPDISAAESARTMSPEEAAAAETKPEVPDLSVLSAAEASIDELRWSSRPLVVFADTPNDPAFAEQMAAIISRPAMLIERDVVVITDTDPDSNSEWRRRLHPQGFSLIVLDKDGQVKLRKPLPWDVREISRAIDKFPLRRQEIGRAEVAP